MMEYPVWRKKPHTPAFVNFMRTYKLEPLSSNLEEAGEILKQVIRSDGCALVFRLKLIHYSCSSNRTDRSHSPVPVRRRAYRRGPKLRYRA